MAKIASKLEPTFSGPVVDADRIAETVSAKVFTAAERASLIDHDNQLVELQAQMADLKALLVPDNALSLDGTEAGILMLGDNALSILTV